MSDDKFEVKLSTEEVLEFQIEESFDLTYRAMEFARSQTGGEVKNLIVDLLDHVNGLHKAQIMLLKEYNELLRSYSDALEQKNGNNRGNSGTV
jgi:hypothetical protein